MIFGMSFLLATLAGCDKSPSTEIQQEFDEGDRIQAEMMDRMNQAAAQQEVAIKEEPEADGASEPAEVAENDFDCPEDMAEASSACAGFLQQKFMSLDLGIVTFRSEEIYIKKMFGDKTTLPNPGNRYFVVGLGGKQRFLVLREERKLDEFDTTFPWHLLDRQTGELISIIGKPLFSPDGMSFVAYNQDLDTELMPNIFDVYAVYGSGPEKNFQGIKDGEGWGPENVEWDGNEAIFFDQLTINTEGGGEFYKRRKLKLSLVNGIWQMH